MTRERFELLDVMRGIAALSIVILHAAGLAGLTSRDCGAGLAVDFFFCLSGFVVAHAYEGRLQSGALSLRRFVVKRLIRLYPMIVAGLAVGFASHIYAEHNVPWQDLGLSLLLIPRLDGWLTYPLDVPMWSLLYELIAAVGFALLVRFTPKAIPWLLAPAALVLACCILLAGHVDTFGVGGPGTLAKGSLRVAYPFLLGAMLYRFRARLPRVPAIVAPAILIAVLLMQISPPWRGVYQALAALAVLPLVVALGARADAPARLHFLGRLSYPIYLVHWGVLLAMREALHGLVSPPMMVVASVAAAYLIAWTTLVAYDEPARAWLTSQLDARRVPAKSTAVTA